MSTSKITLAQLITTMALSDTLILSPLDLGRLVIDTLTEASKADPDRKCFRLIGGVLVERTVKEVLPALQTNLEGVSTTSKRRMNREERITDRDLARIGPNS